jgi:hypothetical protein
MCPVDDWPHDPFADPAASKHVEQPAAKPKRKRKPAAKPKVTADGSPAAAQGAGVDPAPPATDAPSETKTTTPKEA